MGERQDELRRSLNCRFQKFKQFFSIIFKNKLIVGKLLSRRAS
jgi:hypothetical protein